MEQMQIASLATLPQGQQPVFTGYVYGNCVEIPANLQSPAYCGLVVQDDTGKMLVFVPTQLGFPMSSSLVGENVIVANRSGRSSVCNDQNNGWYVIVGSLEDIRTRSEAVALKRELNPSPTGVQDLAVPTALQQTASAVAVETAKVEPSAPMSDDKSETAAAPKPLLMLEDNRMRHLATTYCDCLEAAAVALNVFVSRNPTLYGLTAPQTVKDVASTLFIEVCRQRERGRG